MMLSIYRVIWNTWIFATHLPWKPFPFPKSVNDSGRQFVAIRNLGRESEAIRARSDFLYPPLESDSSYPFLLQNSGFASGNEGPAQRQEETEFYGRIAAAMSGGREEIRTGCGR